MVWRYFSLSFKRVYCGMVQLGTDGDDGGIFLQKFNADGTTVGGEILVNKTTAYYQWLPKIKALDNGNIARNMVIVETGWRP